MEPKATTSPIMTVFCQNVQKKIYLFENNFSFNSPGYMNNMIRKKTLVTIKVAASRKELNPHEVKIIQFVRGISNYRALERTGVPWVKPVFLASHYFFLVMFKLYEFKLELSEASRTAKIREIVNAIHEMVRIELILILFEIIVFIFAFFC